jgi:peptidoglycan/LPS O-acetylase OafA/YrhL
MAVAILLAVGTQGAVAQGVATGDELWARILGNISVAICLGCIGAYLLHSQRGFELAWKVLGQRWSAPVALGLVVACVSQPGVPHAVSCLAMAVLVLACCIREDHVLAPVLGWKPARYIGSVSYGLYLLHTLCIHVVHKALPEGGLVPTFALTLGLSVAVATVSFRVFERPFLRLKERFAWAREGAPAKAPAPVTYIVPGGAAGSSSAGGAEASRRE